MAADADAFTTVFRGSMSEAAMIQAMLEAQELHARIESQHIKNVHPFITGWNVFEVEVKTLTREAPVALEIIRSAREDAAAQAVDESADSDEEDEDEDEESGRAADLRRLEGLGRRLRWGALAIAPTLIWPPAGALVCILYSAFALAYLLEARRLRCRPSAHWLTVSAFAVVLLFLALTVWINAAVFFGE